MIDGDIDRALGGHLIFLISQPRAGSTMLQKILGGHPSIHTCSEPWLMLHPIYGLRAQGYDAEYGSSLANAAVHSFLHTLEKGKEEYLKAIRLMCLYLYDRAIETSGKLFFLDKSPRYYFIIPELYKIFPKAKFIILLRNPLAVLSSIVDSWVKRDWFSLYKLKSDLILAPKSLLKGKELLGERCIIVQYEKFLQDTDSEIHRICKGIGVEFVPEILNYGNHELPKWEFGDQDRVYQYDSPDPRHSELWIRKLNDPIIWRVIKDYLNLLGEDTIAQMGYNYSEFERILQSHNPKGFNKKFIISMKWLLKKPTNKRKLWERFIISLLNDGLFGKMMSVFRKIVS